MIVLIVVPAEGASPAEVATFAVIVMAGVAYALGRLVIRIFGVGKANR